MATTDDPRKAIVGAWRLVHSIEYGPGGERRYPFGEDAVGYIMYSETGVMAVQIARRVRAGDAEGRPDYLAYFARPAHINVVGESGLLRGPRCSSCYGPSCLGDYRS